VVDATLRSAQDPPPPAKRAVKLEAPRELTNAAWSGTHRGRRHTGKTVAVGAGLALGLVLAAAAHFAVTGPHPSLAGVRDVTPAEPAEALPVVAELPPPVVQEPPLAMSEESPVAETPPPSASAPAAPSAASSMATAAVAATAVAPRAVPPAAPRRVRAAAEPEESEEPDPVPRRKDPLDIDLK
jgi:hypothetical protein